MGLRFRKSIGKGAFRMNFSKSGIGFSVGGKGARITKTAKGTTRSTIGIPGTGVSHVSETSNNSCGNKSNKTISTQSLSHQFNYSTPAFFGSFWKFMGWFMIISGILVSLAILPLGLFFICIGLIELRASKKNKAKSITIKEEREAFYREHSAAVCCTNDGKKFHAPSCRYANGSIMTAADALLMGKEPCSICHPEGKILDKND